MMRCNICGSDLKCTLTIDDPLTENEIIRRKYCYNCGITYLTKETVMTIKKGREVINIGEFKEKDQQVRRKEA